MRRKVYCKGCKYLNFKVKGGMYYRAVCTHPHNCYWVDTPKESRFEPTLIKECNRYNNCALRVPNYALLKRIVKGCCRDIYVSLIGLFLGFLVASILVYGVLAVFGVI